MLAQAFPIVQEPMAVAYGSWLIVLAGLLGVLWLCRQLWLSFFPSGNERYVTRAELLALELAMKSEINSVKNGLMERMGDHAEKVKDLSSYVHQSQHDIRSTLHAMQMKLEVLVVTVGKDEAKVKLLLETAELNSRRLGDLIKHIEAKGA